MVCDGPFLGVAYGYCSEVSRPKNDIPVFGYFNWFAIILSQLVPQLTTGWFLPAGHYTILSTVLQPRT